MYKERVATAGQRIKEALTIKNMKRSYLCKHANVPKSSLSLYLSGAYEPKQDRIYEMASILNVSPVWLMGYDVPMEREKGIPTDDVSRDAEELTRLFAQLDQHQQEAVMTLLRSFASNQG